MNWKLDANGILYVRAQETNLADRVLLSALNESEVSWTQGRVRDLISFGALYVDKKRVVSTLVVHQNQILRFHTRPKRYRVPDQPLATNIVFSHPDFIVIDKPQGLPSHATLDNRVENSHFILSRELDHPIFPTHRLDIDTGGLLVFAKSKEAQAKLNRGFAYGNIQKIYEARVSKDVEPKRLVHHMHPSKRAPKRLSRHPFTGGIKCEMEILDCARGASHYSLRILLITGRTHQIRAQLAHESNPVIGDVLYGGVHSERMELYCRELRIPWCSKCLRIS